MIFVIFLRSLLGAVIFVPFTFLLSALAISGVMLGFSKPSIDRIMQWWGYGAMALFGIELRVHGQENLPEGACLVLFNHTSFFDVFSIAATVPGLRFGAKAELFKIPLFGYAMKKVGTLPIHRANRERALRVYEKATVRAQEGFKFALAPEGTRNESETLLPFKAGPFVFAIQSQMPIVPAVIRGAYSVLPKGAILPNLNAWASVIDIEFLAAIPVDGLKYEDRNEVQKIAYEKMSGRLGSPAPSRREFNPENPTADASRPRH